MFATYGLDPERPPVVLNITRWAYRPECTWPDAKYRRLAQELARRPGGGDHPRARARGLDRKHTPGVGTQAPGVLFAQPQGLCRHDRRRAGFYHPRRRTHAFRGGSAQASSGIVVQHAVVQLAALGVESQILGATGPIEPIEVEEVLASLERLGQGRESGDKVS